MPVETVIPVTANPGIHLYISDHTISGDENIDAGEIVELNIELSNSGLTGADSVYAVLSCEYDFITIQNNQSFFDDIAAGVSVWGQANFIFEVDAALEKDTIASFNLTVYDAGSNIYHDEIYFEVKSPVLEQRSKPVILTTNGNLIIEAGETVEFNIDLFNSSRSLLQNVNAILSSESTYVDSIRQSQGAYGDIASYETNTNTNEYVFEVSDDYPGEPEPIIFSLDVSNEFGQQWPFTFDLLEKPDISDIVIDFRGKLTSITLFWTTYDSLLGYNIYRSETDTGGYQKLNTKAILPIAYYEDAGLPELTPFFYKVSAVSLTGNESELSQTKQAWTSLAYHPDWLPITVIEEDHGGFWGAPNVYDLENDGEKEIFISSGTGDQPGNKGTIFGFRHDGEELYDIDENPTSVSGFANIGISMTCSPAIGDIDNDGIVEIVVATRMGQPDNDPTKYRLYVYKNEDANSDDKPDLMWDKQIAYKNFNGVVLSDLNNNNKLEIIVPNQFGDTIEIFDHLGNDYPGWPVTTSENPIDKKAVSMPVAVDLDNDGNKEIVIGLEGGIYIWNNDGSDYLGQNPVDIDIPAGGRLDCPVIAADIDNDDDFEILFMSIQDTTGYIYAIESNGDSVTGWGSDDHKIELSIQSQAWAWPPSFVCGDVDMDGTIEVVIADADTLKVWDNLGNLILNKNIPLLQCLYLQPLIADVDGTDNECEIIIPSNIGIIYAYKLNCDPVLGWPLYLGLTASVPLIGDIDNDSKNEIIAASGSDIYVWDTEGDANKNQWDRFRLNSYNNAVFYNACFFNPNPFVINDDQIWSDDRVLNRDLHIENGKLTIKSTVRFASSAKIIVKPGAELVLDGGKLINGCDNKWQGIEVWGNPSSQYPPDQGMLTVKNGAVIENAEVAIRNHHYNTELNPPDYFQGGIVIASNSTFRNNNKSIDLRNYYYNSFNYFIDCEFIYDEYYSGSPDPGYFVEIRNMTGVNITSCDFFSNTGKNYVGKGIFSYCSHVNIKGKCVSGIQPCTEWENNQFQNLEYGVYAMDNLSGRYVNIRHSTFDQCQRGVYISGIDGARVTSNIFLEPVSYEFDVEKYGLYLNNSTGYHIEDNTFEGPSPSEPGRIGLYVNNSGEDWNQVYNNTFENLQYGIIAYGWNRSSDGNLGLCIECNDYENNKTDILVNTEESLENQGIARNQGHQGLHDTLPAGNTFTQEYVGLEYNYYNCNDCGFISYVYHGINQTGKKLNPDPYYSVKTMRKTVNELTTYTKETSCPSKLEGSGVSPEDDREGIADSDTEIGVKEAQLAALVDGGDTDGMNFDVLLSSPPEAVEVYQDLMSQSPFLSDTVMKTAIYKENVLPNAMIRDVLVANPQSAKDNEVLEALDERFDPMPEWMKNQILQGVNITGAKEAIESELAKWKQKRAEHFNNLYQYFRKDTINLQASADSLEMLLADDPYLSSKYRLVLGVVAI